MIDREFGYENTRDFDRGPESGGWAFPAIPMLALAAFGMWKTGSDWREPMAFACVILCGIMAWWLKHSWFVPANSELAEARREVELRWPSVFIVLAPVEDGPFTGWPVDLKMGPGFNDTEFLRKERSERQKKETVDKPVGDGKVKSWRWVGWEAIGGVVAGMAGSGFTLVVAALVLLLDRIFGVGAKIKDFSGVLLTCSFFLFLMFPIVGATICAHREMRRQGAWEK